MIAPGKRILKTALASGSLADALASVAAVIAGLLVGLVILLLSNAPQALGGFSMILEGGFSSLLDMGQMLYVATPIIMTGLSVGFSARTGLFNIGAAGQFIVGAYAAILVGVKCDFLPGNLHWIAALTAAMLAGALWGAIPGLFKAFFNANEVIVCIMTNYIGMYLVNMLVIKTVFNPLQNQSIRVAASANLPKMGLDLVFRDGFSVSGANSGILMAILFAILMYVVLEKTSLGYELKACGYNRDAAHYAGISVRRGIVVSMVISGALSGLGGAFLYLAGSGKGINVVDVLAMEGFNGIPVALLGLNNPIGIIFSGLLVASLSVGGFNMQIYEFAPQVIEIIIGVIIYFSAFALLLRGLFDALKKRRGK
jgi:simple sugar transport system permease protein